MKKVIHCVKVLTFVFLVTLLFFAATPTPAQSTDEDHPTVISGFPLSANLPAGTYYYQASITGRATVISLDFTTPDGGGSMSASVSGIRCCSSAAYVGADSGRSERIQRQSEPFEISVAQKIMITINVAVSKGMRIPFTFDLSKAINLTGVVVRPPPLQPRGPCTDLAAEHFSVRGRGLALTISGRVRNISDTAYVGLRRLQWVEVLDITDSETDPYIVKQILFTEIPAHGGINYTAVHNRTVLRHSRYKVRIMYAPYNATDRSTTNDDCNSSNDSTTLSITEAP